MVQQLLVSFIAAAAFGMMFNVPRHLLPECGVVGMMGWFVYIVLGRLGISNIPATLVAAFVVTILSQWFARLFKTPIIVFSVAGIIPLVPGGVAYDAMRYFVQNNYAVAVQMAAKALMMSGAIAMGLILSEVVYQLIKRRQFQ
ncbi:threonine/serine exporter family protein [Alicyclobacillus sp. SO9]|uniref:threonine/serine exporter family protein n=1 Tax=Alicyclobacillus sp. SO9 TaxID=2665646 RepID=UPI0018E707DE|nr:threonine/serine exporter family protein [Alicyclobacillus sp. SO9]QQE77533.1 threonine/serine exporter family protein [Alicyclobacillus sp. SO9]